MPACKIFDNAICRKKIKSFIDSARRVENHMLDWYQKIVEGVSGELEKLLVQQFMTVKRSQVELSQLTTEAE